MYSANAIDSLVAQIDNVDVMTSCANCNYVTVKVCQLSCNHLICTDCMSKLIAEYKDDICPYCQDQLLINMTKLFKKYHNEVKLETLSKMYNMKIGDNLWFYSGKDGNWLYNEDNNECLNQEFEICKNNNLNPKIGININTGSKIVAYIIDFNKSIQYPENNPNLCRRIGYFKLTSAKDLMKNKIMGVAGKKID